MDRNLASTDGKPRAFEWFFAWITDTGKVVEVASLAALGGVARLDAWEFERARAEHAEPAEPVKG